MGVRRPGFGWGFVILILSGAFSYFAAHWLFHREPSLHAALRAGKNKKLERLLREGADPRLTNRQGLTVYEYALSMGEFDLAQKIRPLMKEAAPFFETLEPAKEVLLGAHAHNDYENPRPLVAALKLGFQSLEVDVFLKGNQLLVGHSWWQLSAERSLKKMYVNPLVDLLTDPQRVLYTSKIPLILLVDLKTNGNFALPYLEKELDPLSDWAVKFENGKWIPNQVLIVLSGDRPVAGVEKMSPRWMFLDGRLSQLNKEASLYPLISESWIFSENPSELGDGQKRRVQEMLARANEAGQRLRFWGVRDDERDWLALRALGVSLIGTDRPFFLREAFLKH